jgi:hypothetical protein
MARYLLRNTQKYDINLGDLRYTIPAGQVRDLLSKTAHIDPILLAKSVISGSIAARKKIGALVEVVKEPDLRPPKKVEVSNRPVSFPRTKKTSIVLDVAFLDEQMNDMILDDGDQFIKELEADSDALNGSAPLVSKQALGDEKEETSSED